MHTETALATQTRQTTAIVVDDRILSINEVVERFSLSRTAIFRLRKEGAFPRAVVLGPRRFGFLLSDMLAWARERQILA